MIWLDAGSRPGFFDYHFKGSDFQVGLDAARQLTAAHFVRRAGGRSFWLVSWTEFSRLCGLLDSQNVAYSVNPQCEQQWSRYEKWAATLSRLVEASDCELPGFDFLYPHQRTGTKFLSLRRNGCVLADEMGVGKSLQAIAAAIAVRERGEAKDCLLVCPSSLKRQWAEDVIAKFFPGESWIIIDGKAKDRRLQYQNSAFITIANYEILRTDFAGKDDEGNECPGTMGGRTWDIIIADEVHRVRNRKTQQAKVLKKLRKASKVCFGLSGTPMQNNLLELYNVYEFIFPGVMGSWQQFTNRHVTTDSWGSVLAYQNTQEIPRLIKPYYLRRNLADVAKNIPEKVYHNLWIDLSPEQRKFYNSVRDEIVRLRDEYTQVKLNAAQLLAKITYLREVADHTSLVTDEVAVSTKVEELKRQLEEILPDNKVVIFSMFAKLHDILCRELPDTLSITGAVPSNQRQDIVNQFSQSANHNVLLVTTAGGEGLNLQAANYLIMFDQPWNPAVAWQVEGRLHRIGQHRVVNIIRLLAKDTIEEHIHEVLAEKAGLFEEIFGDGTKQESALAQMLAML